MMRFDRITLGRQAKELGFVRDTFEKVCRLADVLSFMESDGLLADSLALKGGTAINLTIFDLPRLSVDIDLDFSKDVSREAMLAEREQINEHIQKYMAASGYTLSLKSKQYHALDSFVYEYVNAGGMKDNLKIEINYMLRCHVLPVSRRPVYLPWNDQELTVLNVDPLEIFSAKTRRRNRFSESVSCSTRRLLRKPCRNTLTSMVSAAYPHGKSGRTLHRCCAVENALTWPVRRNR